MFENNNRQKESCRTVSNKCRHSRKMLIKISEYSTRILIESALLNFVWSIFIRLVIFQNNSRPKRSCPTMPFHRFYPKNNDLILVFIYIASNVIVNNKL